MLTDERRKVLWHRPDIVRQQDTFLSCGHGKHFGGLADWSNRLLARSENRRLVHGAWLPPE
jgi:hypothetical protein